MTQLSRRALGATAVLTATLLAAATTPALAGSAARSRRPRPDATPPRCRPASASAARSAPSTRRRRPPALRVLKHGRQRHRRSRGRGRDARRDRAVQLGHRRRRLLRPLRREDRPGADDRRPRDGAGARCRTTPSSTRRPGSPTTSPRSWSPAASRSGVPGQSRHLADRARPLGHDVAGPDLPPRHPRGSTRLRGRPDVPPADAGEQGRASTRSARRRRLFLPGGDAPRGRLGLPQPRPRARPTGGSPAAASRFLYGGRLGRQIVRVVHDPPEDRGRPRCRCPPAFMEPSDLRAYGTINRAAHPRRLPRATTSTACGRPRAVARRSARR